MKWMEIKVETKPELEEMISIILYDIGAKGLSIEDPNDLKRIKQEPGDWDYIDEDSINKALATMDENRLYLKVYFSEEEKPLEKLEDLRLRLKAKSEIKDEDYDITTRQVEEKDWSENWKKYYKPTRIGKNIMIKPSWEEYKVLDEDILIEMDPGMAFGTGTHETTSMCAEVLENNVEEDDIIYDIGTGSGILSLVSAKLGAKSVIGVDLDGTAVKVAKENVNNNGLNEIITIKQGDLFKVVDGKADIIVANIIADIIINMVADVRGHLKEGGLFISSGIIKDKEEAVKEALLKNEFEILEINRKKEWVCILAKMN